MSMSRSSPRRPCHSARYCSGAVQLQFDGLQLLRNPTSPPEHHPLPRIPGSGSVKTGSSSPPAAAASSGYCSRFSRPRSQHQRPRTGPRHRSCQVVQAPSAHPLIEVGPVSRRHKGSRPGRAASFVLRRHDRLAEAVLPAAPVQCADSGKAGAEQHHRDRLRYDCRIDGVDRYAAHRSARPCEP
jgi:hypothetical protein